MKCGGLVAALVALVTGVALASAQDKFQMLAGFEIGVMRTAKGVSLVCKAGCSWKTLEFPLAVRAKPVAVNDNGIFFSDKTTKQNANFLLRLRLDDDGFALSCDRGCAWRTLGWTFPAEGMSTRITEYGMEPRLARTK